MTDSWETATFGTDDKKKPKKEAEKEKPGICEGKLQKKMAAFPFLCSEILH